ncbi:hypothetical protein SEPCBS57363_002100 [Sporothrix epigloea]|uniref:Uncharacterized protein n=1 Tax=Sporothrix epigloea TaxID=1892477 RepID=A0ABP0DF75_9PEZI
MDSIASALKPIPALVWGERAIYELGVGIVCDDYMLVVDDAHFVDATRKLQSAGFRECSWSFGSVDPAFYQNNSVKEAIYGRIVHQYGNLDDKSARFFFPSPDDRATKVVLLPSSYAHVRPEKVLAGQSSEENIAFPSSALLLQSIVQTLVREPVEGMWTSTLSVWALSYLYGELMMDDNVMDSCEDESARAWFDAGIRRYDGGMDRTRTKRFGRKGYEGP